MVVIQNCQGVRQSTGATILVAESLVADEPHAFYQERAAFEETTMKNPAARFSKSDLFLFTCTTSTRRAPFCYLRHILRHNIARCLSRMRTLFAGFSEFLQASFAYGAR